MRRLQLVIALLIVVAFSVQASKSLATPSLTVYIEDQSEFLPTSQLENALPAFQYAVSKDFAPVWNVDARLVVTDNAPEGSWVLYVEDTTDQFGTLGYHDVTDGVPYGIVYAQDAVDYGEAWQAVLTHELFELLADPYINRMALGWHNWLVEVSDPVESGRFNYSRKAADGSRVPISDFVTPNWYKRISKRGPFDFRRHVSYKGQVLPGGYASYLVGDTWTFIIQP